MFESTPTSTGIDYTATAALVIMAVLVSPVLFVASSWPTAISAAVALTCSVVFLIVARLTWTRTSQLTLVSIVGSSSRSK